MMVGKVKVWLG